MPYLYELSAEVMDEGGRVLEVFAQKVGFRRFAMKDGIMCLNGRQHCV